MKKHTVCVEVHVIRGMKWNQNDITQSHGMRREYGAAGVLAVITTPCAHMEHQIAVRLLVITE